MRSLEALVEHLGVALHDDGHGECGGLNAGSERDDLPKVLGSHEFHPLQCGRGEEELVLGPELGEGRENPDLGLFLEDVVQAVRQVVDAGE